MKKGPRCPVCGSLQIKESAASKAADLKSEAEKLKDISGKKSNWKCYDCYRIFDKPDESG